MSDASSVEALFFAALEKETPAEQAAFLDSACGDDTELRRQVEKLLKAHPRVGDFLKKPVVERLADASEPLDATQEIDPAADGQRKDGDLAFLEPSTRHGSLGRVGHYEILEVLGKGGFGIVFRAFDEMLQRVVAIKVLAPDLAATSPPRKRFLREARSSARVRHENIVQVYAVEDQPLPYLVMEFIPGETLQQRLDRTGPLETAEAVHFGKQIAEGLAAAHEQGLIHRDIKPGNILIEAGPHPCVKITDFGLARAADDASMTQSGVVAGTPMFMAPEQAQGDPLDHRADLFSLGSVLYTMCSGRPPFRANSTLAVLKRVVDDTPRPIPEIIPEVPRWLCDIISKLHAKKPEDRFATAREVADLLAQYQAQMQRAGNDLRAAAEKMLSPRPVPQPAPASKPRFHLGLWAVAGAVLLLLVGGLSFTEANGVTNLRGTVIRLFSPEGTLVVEVDDPDVSVKIDGADLVITGAGMKEIRLAPGSYAVEARKDGKVVSRELVSVTKNGRQVVRVTQVPGPPAPPPIQKDGWTLLKPHEMKSEGGATLTLQDDGRVLASGKLPDRDVYTLLFRGLPSKIEALRLEVLPHDSLPNKGPGRAENGEFVLTTVRAQLHPPANPKVSSNLKLADAWADHSRGDDSLVGFAIDADDHTGWCTEVGKPHYAVFKLQDPVTATETTVLRVTLDFKWDGVAQRSLGCFRLSATSDVHAGLEADRRAAEDVLALGGLVKVNDQPNEIRAPADLPREPFRLTHVNLWEKRLTAAGLSVFKDCKHIKELELHRTNVTDAGLAHFKDCKGLMFLNLTGTPITDAGLAAFKDCKDLVHLNLSDSQVTDAGLAHFKDCKNLKELWLYFTRITDAGLAHLKDSKQLTFVNLHGTQVTDAGLAQLKDCKDLTVLQLGNTKVTDAGLAHLVGCKLLTQLQLDGTAVTDAGLGTVAAFDQLTVLSLQKAKVSAKAIDGLKKTLPKCRIEWDGGVIDPKQALPPDRRAAEYVLSLGGAVRVNDADREIKAAGDLPREPFRLTFVSLRETKQLTDAGLVAFKDCKNLTGLIVSFTEVGDAGLANFKDCKNLTDLELRFTQVTDAGLANFKDCQNLNYVNLTCTKVSDAGLAHLKNCKNLKSIALDGTQVTDAGLAHLKNCKELTELMVPNLPISDAGLADLKECKNLRTVNLNETKVSDASLAQLKECKDLALLKVEKTKVTAAGVEGVKKALPQCRIEWDGGVIEPMAAKPQDAAVWERAVAGMTAEEQVKAVGARLKELNPAFDGKVIPTIENDVVTGLQFLTDEVDNIAPVRALKGLTSLECNGTRPRKGKLSDLSPLQGMSLKRLDCHDTQVGNLTPLQGMPLTSFSCSNTRVSDFTPLKGMALVALRFASTQVQDLSPLKGMKLEVVEAQAVPVTDLTPLRGMPLKALDLYKTVGVTDLQPLQGMPLEYLNLAHLPASDLSPLKGMTSLRRLVLDSMGQLSDLSPLKEIPLILLDLQDCSKVRNLEPLQGMPLKKFWGFNTGVTDLSPLRGMPLEEIRLTPKNITQGLDILRDLKSLKTIGLDWEHSWPTGEFWERSNKGEFTK